MNILLLSQFFSTTKGGGEYVFSILAKSLADRGHKIWVITNKIKGETYVKHENIRIIFVPPVIEYRGGLPPGFDENLKYAFWATIKGHTIIKKENIDIIHSNNFAPAIAGSTLSTITGKSHITAIHDVFSLCGKNYWKKWGKQSNVSKLNVILAPFFEKMIIRLKHDAIHTVSEATKDDLVKFGATRPIYVIHNVIENNSQLIKKINPKQFVYVGRLVFYKNLEVLIKAISIARKIEPEIRLVIAGDGPHRKTLEELTESLELGSNIEFRGFVSKEEKDELIASSNAMAFPSLCEGFGLVILEAFSQNKPVLVSDVRPMSDIISNKKNGYVLKFNDENMWAEHMLELVHDPDLSYSMGQAGNHLLRTSFNQESMYNQIVNMYINCIKNNHRLS